MATNAVARIGRSVDGDPTVALLRLACALHAQMGQQQGWLRRDYDGPDSCYWCTTS